MVEIARRASTANITAGSVAATTSPRIAYQQFAGGGVLIASTAGATVISWYGAKDAESLPLPIYADGSPVTTAVVVGGHPIPDACFGFPFIVPVVAGSTACAMTVCLKG
jgi:hypothetical protein